MELDAATEKGDNHLPPEKLGTPTAEVNNFSGSVNVELPHAEPIHIKVIPGGTRQFEQRDHSPSGVRETQTKTDAEEYETSVGGTRKQIRSSLTEMVTRHSEHRTYQNVSPDRVGASFPDLSEHFGAKYKQSSSKLARTPVSASERMPAEPRQTVPSGFGSANASHVTKYVSDFRELPKRDERVINVQRDLVSPKYEDASTEKEILHQRIRSLKSELREARNSSEMATNDLNAMRKEMNMWISKSAQQESLYKRAYEKMHEYKNLYRQLRRSTKESGLSNHEASALHRLLDKTRGEFAVLANDYELVRESLDKKMHENVKMSVELSNLYRKLEVLEHEKQQLEMQVYHQKSATIPRKSYDESGSLYKAKKSTTLPHRYQKMTNIGISRNPEGYGTIPRRTEESKTATRRSRSQNDYLNLDTPMPGWNEEYMKLVPPPSLPANGVDEVKQTPNSTTSPTGEKAHGDSDGSQNERKCVSEMQERNGKQLEKGAKQRTPSDSANSSADLIQEKLTPKPETGIRENSGEHGNTSDTQEEAFTHPRINRDVKAHHGFKRPTLSRKGYPISSERVMMSGENPASHHGPRPRFGRPYSAFGFFSSKPSITEYELYPSPLPPRSTTSMARAPMVDYYSSAEPYRFHDMRPRMPLSSYSIEVPMHFRTLHSSSLARAEIALLEDKIYSLEREKARIERQYGLRRQKRRSHHSYERRGDIVDILADISSEIRSLKGRLSRLRTRR